MDYPSRPRFQSYCTAPRKARQGLRWLACLLLCGVWALVGFGPPVLTSGETPPAWRLYPGQIRMLAAATRMPPITARAALLADAETGEILLSYNADQPLPPASTTKIMTALITLERADPRDVVTVPGAALIGESSMGLMAGERVTVEELLYGLLMVSGNDAAMALAYHVAGSPEAFVALMNQRAAELGLRNTRFVNPHGLDVPGHVMSAADLLVIAREAMRYELFRRIVATPQARVAGRLLINRNELLTRYPGADGIKTGTTDAAGQCLVATVTRNGRRVIAVILGSRDRYADAQALFDHYFTYFGWYRLDLPGGGLDRVRWPDGRVRELVATADAAVLLPRWQWPLVRVMRIVEGDGQPDTPAGRAVFRLGSRTVAEVPLRWREP